MNFEPLAHSEQCKRASNSSYVVVAEVRKTTLLTQKGQQRDVNLVGAACIAAIRNLFPLGSIPYFFGGDGATFLVEDSDLEKCMDALQAVQNMANRNLKIGLRIGYVSLRDIRQQGADVLYGSVKSGEEELMTFLRGDGISLADRLVKQRDKNEDTASKTDSCQIARIEGLACRLLPFRSRRGKVVSFIADPLVHGAWCATGRPVCRIVYSFEKQWKFP